ncbi:MAG: bifunctional glutamate N-acetyltransferase/amino-acid acetyltransferase ArgJ [Alphaproteobacteria bacterium]|nr:MAG: bifunctional glutamate N-acetyltransferase/amino-acid acetyltransferase ArgJ [Alphaproteobacteria bacterium]
MTTSPFAPKNLPTLASLRGVSLGAVCAGIRHANRLDMMMMRFDAGAHVAGVYTRSLTAAAPILWCRSACDDGEIRALLVNSGNANAYTGTQGMEDVRTLTAQVAHEIGCDASQVMICSTGVIGEFLPVPSMMSAIPPLHQHIHADGWDEAARAIMTTDTFPKMATRTCMIASTKVTIHGIAKGSGMIAPDMATMLGFIVTDASLPAAIMKPLLARYTVKTFNSITVDSDTSTNDAVLMVATGGSNSPAPHSAGDPILDEFKETLYDLMKELALLIVKDGEGARKFITYRITGAEDDESARIIGLAIANSPLVKTALAASDPNWGRIIAAVGKAGRWINPDQITLYIGDELVTHGGAVVAHYNEANAKAHMLQSELFIRVDVGVGEGCADVWGCDLTERYIEINANYRS